MAQKVYVYYSCQWEDIRKIQQRFNLPDCVTVNGETCQPCEIADEDWELLRETEKRGYIQIRMKQ